MTRHDTLKGDPLNIAYGKQNITQQNPKKIYGKKLNLFSENHKPFKNMDLTSSLRN